MSLQERLEALASNAKKVSLVDFSESSTEVISDLITRKRKLIREPEAHELKLQALCAGDFTTTKLIQDLTKTNPNRTTTKREEIEKILKAANVLNQICNLPEMKTRIEKLAHIHEERQTNLEYLYESSEKNQAKIDKLKENKPVAMEIDDEFDDSALHEATLSVERLTLDLEERKAQRALIQQKKQEQYEIRATLDELQQSIRASMTDKANEKTQLLQDRVLKEKQKIQELDSKIKAIEDVSSIAPHPQPTFKIRELSVGFKARIDKLLHSRLQEPTTTNLIEVSLLFQSIQKEIQAHLLYLNEIESNERHEQAAGQVYIKILDFIQHHSEKKRQTTPHLKQFQTIFPNSQLTDTSFLDISQEASMLTLILAQLHNNSDRSMLLSDLTRFVQDSAKKQGYSEQEADQCIFRLVGLDLVMVDRSQNESVVRLI